MVAELVQPRDGCKREYQERYIVYTRIIQRYPVKGLVNVNKEIIAQRYEIAEYADTAIHALDRE